MRGMVNIVIIAVMQFIFSVGCQTIPVATQGGRVNEILISDHLTRPIELSINAGDEILWINKSTASIRILFPARVIDKLVCRRNFSGWFSGGTETTLSPNESASLCFGESIYSTYLIRMTGGQGGEVNVTGVLHVGEPS